MSVIAMEAVSKHYVMGVERVQALDAVDFEVMENDYVAIAGSSGSGKSTLMGVLGCLDRPSSGRYLLQGRDVTTLDRNELAEVRNRQIGFIFQSFHLIPRLTALANVMQPLLYGGVSYPERKRRAADALERVGLGARMAHQPNQLSGGQRQRVAVARALVTRPSLLLADEPTGNLDSATSADILQLFDDLHAEGQTILLVTHDPEIAARCHRIVRLKDGRIISDQRAAA
jgi:putative ABC transport system ATP-binding protein